MSGDGPDSIPTSADPRSRRPTKKRALSPLSAQAASLNALLANPHRDIRIPPSASAPSASRSSTLAPPDIITNVQGSSAGAGSGEFHVYKAARRREYERLRRMDDDLRRDKDTHDFHLQQAQHDRRDDEKTRKNRQKRQKAKARKASKPAVHSPTKDHHTSPNNHALASHSTDTPLRHIATLDSQLLPQQSTPPLVPGLVIHADDDD
ncbi:hypothetical protein CDD82_7508 [Ophiocordyceps australis]|uniref:DUF1168 domain protein n=1 Tax=Ophiocordyceps australis TaxID=1399860 RepID=A0A2C5YS09_9HYPO|nr:hypothetical protein CDD82_7508 [Ophiocordyceps australis]